MAADPLQSHSSAELIRIYQGAICDILDSSEESLESLTVHLFSNGIIDELTKNKAEVGTEMLDKVLGIMRRQEVLQKIVGEMHKNKPQTATGPVTSEEMETLLSTGCGTTESFIQAMATKKSSPEVLKKQEEQSMVCTSHKKSLDLFCETCQQLICRDCTVKKHRDHDYDLITDTYHQHKDTIVQSSLQPLNEELHRLVAAKQTLANRRNEIFWNDAETKEEIQRTITQIKNCLDETEKKLMENVDLASNYKVSVVDQQIKELDKALHQVTECRDHVEQCVKVGSPQQVLSAKPQMMSRTQSVITNVKDKTFQPLEQPDIQLVKSDAINQIHNNIGKVKYTLHPRKLKISRHHIPLLNQESTITVSFSLPDGFPTPVPLSFISCHLNPPDNSPPIQCSVKESSQSGQYNVVFTPLTKGTHQLHVTVNESNIQGSPVNVPVSVPPEMRNTLIKTITGLNGPTGVAVTDDGLVIVCESKKHCITILDREGQKKIRSFGSNGNGKGQLQNPQGVAITSQGTLLVSCNNHRIQEFTMEGDCISCVGTWGNGPLQFRYPRGIAINKTARQVYVVDKDNNRVQVLHLDLTFSHMLGSGKGQFSNPHNVSIDSQGFVYVADCPNNCVQKFTPEGQCVNNHLFGTEGSEPSQLLNPTGIAIDDNDLLYVNSRNNDFVSFYTTNGQYIGCVQKNLDCKDSSPQMFGATVSDTGDLYICCRHENKMLVC